MRILFAVLISSLPVRADGLDLEIAPGWTWPGKAALLSVGEQIDTRSAAGRLVLNVLASVSQWEREAIGERTATAMQYKAKQGEYTGGQAPYGRRVAPDGSQLEPHPDEVAARAVARQLRAHGLSLRAVAAELHQRGIRSRTGRGFAPVQVKRMVG
jgi:site-specific DNA recombinase